MEMNTEGIDYRMPLEINCIMVDQVPHGNGAVFKIIDYKARILWKDIVFIEEFVKYYNLPSPVTTRMTQIHTGRVVHIVKAPYEIVADGWDKYKQWSNSRPSYNLLDN